MVSRAERLLGRFFHYATHANVPREAFLEASLAAALEHPEVWQRFVAKVSWATLDGWAHVAAPPKVDTQEEVTGGRSDITLRWPGHTPVVLELKIHDPPAAEQVETYLAGAHVAAVAKHVAHLPVRGHATHRWLGVVPWQRFRELDWPDAPLVLRQLHHLIDTLGVAMPRIHLHALSGMLSSWDAWNTFDGWSLHAAHGVIQRWSPAGLMLVSRNKRQPPIESKYQRFAYLLWRTPWSWSVQLGAFVGLYMGRPATPTLVEGLPDLFLALHVSPTSAVATALQQDASFATAVTKWLARGGEVTREHRPADSKWEFVRARASVLPLLGAPDQQKAFQDWFQARAAELVEDGIIARVAAAASCAPATPEAPGDPTEAPDAEAGGESSAGG
jgi:hypothetical protein